jgi:CRP-like cAMP-binding protein
MSQDLAEALASIDVFEDLTAEDARVLRFGGAALVTVQAGAMIFEAGARSDALYGVVEAPAGSREAAAVELYAPTPGPEQRVRLERIGECEAFGEVAFAGRGDDGSVPRRAMEARAATPSVLVKVPYAALERLDPATLARVERRIAQRLARKVEAHIDLVLGARFDDATTRLASWLEAALLDYGIPEGAGARLARKVTQEDIGRAVGIGRETVNEILNAWMRAGLVTSRKGGVIAVPDTKRLAAVTRLGRRRAVADPEQPLWEIDVAIARGDLFRARNLALDALRAFPGSPRLRHRAVLATARAGGLEEASRLLTAFGFDGGLDAIRRGVTAGLLDPRAAPRPAPGPDGDDGDQEDDDAGAWPPLELVGETAAERAKVQRLPALLEDIAALYARVAKDRAFATRDAGERRRFLLEARKGYACAARLAREGAIAVESVVAAEERRDPKPLDPKAGVYSLVNEAAILAALGEGKRAGEVAAAVARAVSGASDYWETATAAEAALVAGRAEEARALFAAARGAKGASAGAIASTRRQIERFAPAMNVDAAPLLAALPQGRVAAITGHMMLGKALDAARQAAEEASLAALVKTAVKREGVAAAFGALAAGGDIVIAEAIVAAGADLHVVLPMAVEDFAVMSVDIGDPPGAAGKWRARFEALLGRAASVTVLQDRKLTRREMEAALYHGNRHAAGLALLAADTRVAEPLLLAVHDGAGPQALGGTSRLVADWTSAGLRVERFPSPWRDVSSAQAQTAATPYRAVVFAWIAARGDTDEHRKKSPERAESLFAAAEAAIGPHLHAGISPRRRKLGDTRLGHLIACEDFAEAAALARALAPLAPEDMRGLRVVADFGPIVDPAGAIDPELVKTLDGATDDLEWPLGTALATEAFAAEARFELGHRIAFASMGRVGASTADDGMPLPSVRLFGIG